MATPPFEDEHEELRQTLRRFVDNELRPHAMEWEDAKWMPDEVFRRCGQLGFLGLKYEERYGGQGGGYLHDAVLAEELARCGSGGVGAAIGGHINIATPPIWKFGTEDQKQRWLVPGIKGEKVGALVITEPDAGSDVAGIRTHAERVDGGWVVNGSKTFITNGVRADFVVTAVKTTPDGGHHGLSFFVIEKGMEGFSVSRKLEKLGWHASDTAELAFQDVFVPEENLLGELNRGFYLIMANFQWERLGMALGAVGKQFHLLERALEYVNERTAFGRPIGKFQVTRHKIAEIALRAETGRALTYRALGLFVNGHDALRETTMAKLLTQRDCVRTADDVVQLFGGNGYMREYEVERALRDARLGPIGGGSDEIMKEILGRQLGL
ncbi:MAG: acyl-CoA dehydrogenase [Thermoleophilaceae bacterium]|nr:acyl-CoA dehydrogenase [Thermoleophilaceae bacterium]